MPIALHLALLTVVGLVGLVGGFVLGILGHGAVVDLLPTALQDDRVRAVLFGMPAGALGYVVARAAFTAVFTARCPKCGGAMEHRGSQRKAAVFGGSTNTRVSYRCTACGHVHTTNVSASDTRHLP